jgi:hypothetical protein
MKIIIEGNADQVKDGCATIARALRASRSQAADYQRARVLKQRAAQKRNREQRAIIRRAFDLIRNDPTQKSTVNDLARALGGSAPVTDEIMISAKHVIAAHGER